MPSHMMHVNRKYLEGENEGFQKWIVRESEVLTIKSEVKLADTGWIFDMYDRGL